MRHLVVHRAGYIVDSTRGILPGAPRLIQVGMKQNF